MNPSLYPRYHWFLWNVLSRLFVRFYLHPLYNFRKSNNSDILPKAPFIVVANHGTFFDPWIIGSFSWAPFNFMCNDDAFRASAGTRWYLESIGAFPKKKGAVDVRALKETLRRLARKSTVCIFPEGQTTWDGSTQLINRGIERLAKQAQCPIVMARVRGNFLSKPWWAETKRQGRIEVDFKVIPVAEIAALSPDALFERIHAFIQQNDIKDPENLKAGFRGVRLAHGLERFVWICMQCGAEDRLLTAGNEIGCEVCGGKWKIDALCRLTALDPKFTCLADLKDWSDDHRRQVLAKIGNALPNAVLTESIGVTLLTVDADGYTFSIQATGSLRLTKNKLVFSPNEGIENQLDIPLAEIRDLVIQKKDIFEIRHQETYYRFLFKGHSPMKWLTYIRYLGGYAEQEKQGWLG